MLSLKTASKKIDYEISCSLDLIDSNYKLVISEMNTNSESFLKRRQFYLKPKMNTSRFRCPIR